MLFWGLIACTRREPYYATPDSGPLGDTSDTDDSGDPPAAPPWEDDAFWTEPGPFAPLVDLDRIPSGPHWETWMFTSLDASSWDSGTVVSHSLSSLDLLVLDGGIILGGSTRYDEELGVEAPFENYFAVVSADLESWGSHMLPVTDATHGQIVDPSLHIDPDGEVRMIFYGASVDVDPTKNPEDYPGPHPIYTATWDGAGFAQDPEPLLSEEALVDPTGCTWQGQHHVLATGETDLFSALAADVGEEYAAHAPQGWGGVQVPHCFVEGDRQWILVQTGGGFGAPAAVTREPGGSFSEPFTLLPLGERPFNNCTSPVMGHFLGKYVVFCAVWI